MTLTTNPKTDGITDTEREVYKFLIEAAIAGHLAAAEGTDPDGNRQVVLCVVTEDPGPDGPQLMISPVGRLVCQGERFTIPGFEVPHTH